MIDGLKPYAAMKVSGTNWLAEVPTHWGVRRLRTIAEMRISNVDKIATSNEYPVRLCNYTDVYNNDRIRADMSFMAATASADEIERFGLRTGDVLITKDSESWNDIGVPALVESTSDDLVSGYHLALLRPYVGRIGGAYLFRSLSSPDVANQFHVRSNGVTRFGLSQDAIRSVWLPLPPPSEQTAIVRFLDHADRRIRRYIRAKEKLIALLEEQKQAIIYETVIGRIDVRTGKPYPAYKPSGVDWLGEVPSHWDVRRAKRVFGPRNEYARPGDTQLSATQAYGVIAQAKYEAKIGRKITKISRHLDKRRHVEVNDFVISMRSFQGGLERAWEAGCIRSSYIVLRPATRLDVGYFAHLFKSVAYIAALQMTANFIRDGQDLNYNNFCGVNLPFPPRIEQQKIADALYRRTEDTNLNIQQSRREIELMREYRTRLIADVVTGKLDVREAVTALPEVDPLAAAELAPWKGTGGGAT